MKRLMYISQVKKSHECDWKTMFVAPQDRELTDKILLQQISEFHVFCHDRFIFCYMEAPDDRDDFSWPATYNFFLEPWAGAESARFCIPLLDIFHDGVPGESGEWRFDFTSQQQVGMLAKLKPEMYASYVYYHYQSQEEHPGSFNKYYIIGSYENYIFAYYELPAIKEEVNRKGKLQTNHTPDHWQEVMEPHFLPWVDYKQEGGPWVNLEALFHWSGQTIS